MTATRNSMLRIRQPWLPLGLLLLFPKMTTTLFVSQSSSADSSQPRQLQLTETQTATYQLTLQFSIWFPDEPVDQRETFVELLNDMLVFNPVRAAILNGLESFLCSTQEDGTCIVEPGTPSRRRSRHRHLQDTTPSVLMDTPVVEIRRRSREEYSWTVWTVSYPVLQIGDAYLLEALMNEPFLVFDDLDRAAVEAMQQVSQLELELAIMQGDFDDILQYNLRGIVPRVYSSPIRKEFETFEAISKGENGDNEENPPLEPRLWYPLRACGAGLLVLSIGTYVFLLVLASRRRDQITFQEQESRSIVLESAEGVARMLTQSATVGGDDGSVSEASMARTRAARVRRRSSNGSGAHRRRPSGDGLSVSSRASRASREEDDDAAARIRLPGTLQIS